MLSPEELESQAETLPCAEPALLGPLKRSAAYAALRPRLADRRVVDSWEANLCHHFVFATATSYLVFVMRWEGDEPYRVFELVSTGEEAFDLVSPWGES